MNYSRAMLAINLVAFAAALAVIWGFFSVACWVVT